MMSRGSRKTSISIGSWIFVIVLVVIMLTPFAWMVSTSFKPVAEVFKWPPDWIPDAPTLQNYPQVMREVPFLTFFKNSFIVASVVVVACLFTSSLAGYAFAKFNFKGRDTIFIIILATMMIPFPVLIIPLYMLMDKFHLIDTYGALIIPSLVSAYGIFLMRQFIRTIPDELIDAGRIDGCSEFGIYWRIVLPACRPALATLGVLLFIWNWDSFLWPVIVINKMSMRTIPLGLATFMWEYGGPRWNLIMTGTVIATIPVLIVFILGQKQIISGMVLSGMKG